MADIWEVTPKTGVTNGGGGNFTFSENTGTTDRVYTITYSKTDSAAGTGVTGSTTYTVKPCCAMPGSREVSGTPFCNGVDKYVHISYQKTCNAGATWEEVYSEDKLVERNSPDCQPETGCSCVTLGALEYDDDEISQGVSGAAANFSASCGTVSAVTDTEWIEEITIDNDGVNDYIYVKYNDYCDCDSFPEEGLNATTGIVTVTLDGEECEYKKLEIVRGPVIEHYSCKLNTVYSGFNEGVYNAVNDVANGKKFVLKPAGYNDKTIEYTAETKYKCSTWSTTTNYKTFFYIHGNDDGDRDNKLYTYLPITYDHQNRMVEYNDDSLTPGYEGYYIRKSFEDEKADIIHYKMPGSIGTETEYWPCLLIYWEGVFKHYEHNDEYYRVPYIHSENVSKGVLKYTYGSESWPHPWHDVGNYIKEEGFIVTVTITLNVNKDEQSTIIEFECKQRN